MGKTNANIPRAMIAGSLPPTVTPERYADTVAAPMSPLLGPRARRWAPVVLVVEAAALTAMALFLHAHPKATSVDRTVGRWTKPAPGSAVHAVANAITTLGFAPVALAIAALVAAWCWRRRDRALALTCLVAPPVALFLEIGLKHLVERPGLSPDERISEPAYSFFDRLFDSSKYSFPSGHATAIAAVAVVACVVVWRFTPRRVWRVTVVAVAIVVTAAVAVTRLVLQAHLATDVAGGVLTGSLEALAVVAFADRLRAVPASDGAGNRRRG